MKTNKMRWNKPELLVMTRSNPEEAVLAACKNADYKAGPGDHAMQCKNWPDTCRINAAS